MRRTSFFVVFALSMLLTVLAAQADSGTKYKDALAHSDIVLVCKVVIATAVSHHDKSVEKSYRVSFSESLHFGFVGLNLPGLILIEYVSSDYPVSFRSGMETTYQNGDHFVAFIDYDPGPPSALRVVRIDGLEKKEDIERSIGERFSDR